MCALPMYIVTELLFIVIKVTDDEELELYWINYKSSLTCKNNNNNTPAIH